MWYKVKMKCPAICEQDIFAPDAESAARKALDSADDMSFYFDAEPESGTEVVSIEPNEKMNQSVYSRVTEDMRQLLQKAREAHICNDELIYLMEKLHYSEI